MTREQTTELEHELAAALGKVDEQRELLRLSQEENEERRRDIVYLATEKAKLENRIQRLEEANAEIRRLKQVIKRKQKALLCVIPYCKHLHHEKGHGHKKNEPCPVVNIVYDGIMQNACDL